MILKEQMYLIVKMEEESSDVLFVLNIFTNKLGKHCIETVVRFIIGEQTLLVLLCNSLNPIDIDHLLLKAQRVDLAGKSTCYQICTPEFELWGPHGRRRNEPTFQSCLLTFPGIH